MTRRTVRPAVPPRAGCVTRRRLAWAAAAASLAEGCARPAAAVPPGACDPVLALPPGFCALVVADGLGLLRHVAVTDDGRVYVARWAGRGRAGGIVALRDTTGDARADEIAEVTNDGGSGLALAGDALYFSTWTAVLRYRLAPGRLAPGARPDTILAGLPRSGHAARSVALGRDGRLFVNVGAPSNSCQVVDKARGSPGRDPCPELERFAGVWALDTARLGQRQADARRVAGGIRHMVALAVHPATGALFGVQHGRDDLHEAFPALYDARAGHRLAAEEVLRVEEGRDYGWPYCYFDDSLGRKVLAPEYGGDGARVGRCAAAAGPVATFPAHWAPNGLLFYRGAQFPARYRGGAFVAFHGAWYRPPPDNGFSVGFMPFAGERPSGPREPFATGFAGASAHPARARHRPVGLAEGPDGSLYVTDDAGGRVWRVVYRAGAAAHGAAR